MKRTAAHRRGSREQCRAFGTGFDLIECHWQRCQSTQTEIVAPDNRAGPELHIRRAAHERCKGELPFDARQRSAEAKVAGPTKSEMTIVGARQIEPVRIAKTFRVTIAGGHDGNNRLTLANQFAAELCVFPANAGGVLTRTFVAQ